MDKKSGRMDLRRRSRSERTTLVDMKKQKRGLSQIVFIIYLFVIVFLGLFAYLIYFQVKRAPDLKADYRNPQLVAKEERVTPGRIYAADGVTILATNGEGENRRTRIYPLGPLFAHPIGYSARGRTGLEQAFYKDLLTTEEDERSFIDRVRRKDEPDLENGNSVVSTLDVGLQQACFDAMGSRRGAIVLMEPDSGKVRAMVSRPAFNPNELDTEWDKLATDEAGSPLLNRATQGLYPPGSTFKILTALEYMRENPNYMSFGYQCNGVYSNHGIDISCAYGRAHGYVDLRGAIAQSCNGAFSEIGLSLDIPKWRSFLEEFGLNGSLPMSGLAYEQSRFSLQDKASYGEVMHTAFGQGNTLMTPMQNCFIAATIANGGVMMQAQFVDHIVNSTGNQVRGFAPVEHKRVLTTDEAKTMTDMMAATVTEGIASPLGGRGYTVACKTGTAQYNENRNTHNLLIGFAPAENPKIAFSIILEGYEGQPEVDTDLMTVAQRILDTYFSR
ncbi:MAG: penicillin-binding transpeptidase domain-containing protein [Eubacteriales bacterium]|nr:penicillin-binding transpeptidase domain-containing protein [Eubacteriales bacterium]